MSFKDTFVDAFISGLGKTTAALAIMGAASGVWYLTNYQSYSTEKVDAQTNTHTDNIDVELEPVECEDTDKYKKIFDKLP
jgi:hypothetical protein